MFNILLIDDEAENGWKEVIEKVLFPGQTIDFASDQISAQKSLSSKKYDLIFLDLRFGENDHIEKKIENFTGYKLLKNSIRKAFDLINFSTPVIVFTASNKIWNIFTMLDNGADSYYIKEHPDTSFDFEFSRNNFIQLKTAVPNLIELGRNRASIQEKSLEIINLLDKSISDVNIRERVYEKLMIAYVTLFNKIRAFEKEILLYNKELLSFIVLFSILEEISTDYFNRLTESDPVWILRKSGSNVQYYDSDQKLITKFNTIKEENISEHIIEFNSTSTHIPLSNQISAILRYEVGWNHHEIHLKFLEKLNKFRNDIDFIHSSTDSIRKRSLKQQVDRNENFNKCIQMLDFLIILLK